MHKRREQIYKTLYYTLFSMEKYTVSHFNLSLLLSAQSEVELKIFSDKSYII